MTLSNILEVLSLMALKRWPAPLSSNRSLILHTFLQFNGFLYLAEYGSYKQWHPFPLGLQLRAGTVHPNPFLLTFKYTSHFIFHGPSWSAHLASLSTLTLHVLHHTKKLDNLHAARKSNALRKRFWNLPHISFALYHLALCSHLQ